MNGTLKKMLNWILDNKEWIFGGIGVVILSTISSLIINLIIMNRNKKEEQIYRIAQRYVDVLDGKIQGRSGIVGLIESGAVHLSKNKQLIKVCEIITQHGKQNPLNGWILNYIDRNELLQFTKWQANKRINFSDYSNEKTFAELFKRYKEGKS